MTTLSRAYPLARKAHRCDSCGGAICAGDRYHRWTGTGDEWTGVARMKECADCAERYGRPVPVSHRDPSTGED